MNPRIEQHRLHSIEFELTFGKPLGHFMDPIFGFDLVRFDEHLIKPEEGQSTEEAIKARYGQRAVNLIRELITEPSEP